MLRVGERVLLLALSEERDKHPLGYLSSRLLADAEGKIRSDKTTRGMQNAWMAECVRPASVIISGNINHLHRLSHRFLFERFCGCGSDTVLLAALYYGVR